MSWSVRGGKRTTFHVNGNIETKCNAKLSLFSEFVTAINYYKTQNI